MLEDSLAAYAYTENGFLRENALSEKAIESACYQGKTMK